MTEGEMKNLAWSHASVVMSQMNREWFNYNRDICNIDKIVLHSIIREAFVRGYETASNPLKLIKIQGS